MAQSIDPIAPAPVVAPAPAPAAGGSTLLAQYSALTKPRVVQLIVFCALIGIIWWPFAVLLMARDVLVGLWIAVSIARPG